jgi:tetratricopeptide (TPR) repeat protein
VTGAEHLGVVLDRDPDRCEEVWEIARRFAEREANSSPIQSVKARAAVLLAVRDKETAQEAVVDLRRLAELDRDRLEEALDGLETVLGHRPELLEGRFLREELLRALGRVDDAIGEARAILKLVADPNDEYDARYRLADALEAKNLYAEALEEWLRLEALGGVPEEAREEVPRRIRENFLGRTAWELENVPAEEALKSACAALRAGRPEEVLRALPPDAVPEDDHAIHWLALRGASLLALERHEQLLSELRPHLAKVPIEPPLSPFEREFLFALGRSSLEVGERDWAFHCLERVARDAPYHRGVRRLLDHGYHLQAAGQEPALEMTLPMEEVAHA